MPILTTVQPPTSCGFPFTEPTNPSNPKVIKVAIEPLQPAELPKMVDGLRRGKRKRKGGRLDVSLMKVDDVIKSVSKRP